MAETILTYEYNSSDKAYTVIGVNSFAGGELTIPTTYNDGSHGELSVVRIGKNAFKNCDVLTSVTIPATIKNIDMDAFYDCDGLTTVTFQGNVALGQGVFYSCNALSTITGLDKVTSFGDYMFYRCESLKSVTLPASTKKITAWMFRDCYSLESITIPNSVTEIGDYAFQGCRELTSITIPDFVTTIGIDVVRYCSNLTNIIVNEKNTAYQSINGNLYSKGGTVLVAYARGKTETSFTIPNSVTSIQDGVFYGYDKLTSITIPNSVTTIGKQVFYDCGGLTSITIPNSVTNIDYQTFSGCDNLISVTIGNSVTSIGIQAFAYCDNLASIAIPNSTTSIGQDAFRDCKKLTSVIVPDSVTSIGKEAFYGCSTLKSIYYKDIQAVGLTIGEGNEPFTSATSYNYSENHPTEVGYYWHYQNDKPANWCNGMTIVIDAAIAPTCTTTGKTQGKHCSVCNTVLVAQETVSALGHAEVAHAAQAATCTEKGHKAYVTCSRCDYTTFEETPALGHAITNHQAKAPTCEEIGWDAYETCSRCDHTTYAEKAKLGHDYVIDHVEENGENLDIQYKCSRCPKTYETIGASRTDFTITSTNLSTEGLNCSNEEGVFEISAFFDDGSKWYVVKGIEEGVFQLRGDLKQIIIPHTVTDIKPGGVWCPNLETIEVASENTNYKSVNGNLYSKDGTKLVSYAIGKNETTFSIPDTVEIIENWAFFLNELTDITIPNSVTTIGENAFFRDGTLEKVYYTGSKQVWENCKSQSTDLASASIKLYNEIHDCDFLAFTFNGYHSLLDLNIIRTSDGDRYNHDLTPQIKDTTAENPGGDGMYYFKTNYPSRQFNINFAFDSLTEQQIRKLKQVFSVKELCDLIFDEEPYKVWSAKVTGTPTIKYVPFDNSDGQREYRGEGSVQFTAYWPFAHTPKENTKISKKFRSSGTFEKNGLLFNNYDEWLYPTKNQWKLASGLKETGTVEAGENYGDLVATFVLSNSASLPKDSVIKVGGLEITLADIVYKLKWDSKTGIVSGTDSSGDETKRKPVSFSGNSLGGIPVGDSITWGIQGGESPNYTYSTTDCTLDYQYWYY